MSKNNRLNCASGAWGARPRGPNPAEMGRVYDLPEHFHASGKFWGRYFH